MDSTQLSVRHLLRALDGDFRPFAGAEESIILSLVTGTLSADLAAATVDWHRLEKAGFSLAYFHQVLKDSPHGQAPDGFLKTARSAFLHNLAANEFRLRFIGKIADLGRQAGIEILFVKGAAELALWHQDSAYLGQRYMDDVDIICHTQDLCALDKLLEANGYKLHSYDFAPDDRAIVQQLSMSKYGHYVYDAHTRTHLEVHIDVATRSHSGSYPPDFAGSLFASSRLVELAGAQVRIPSAEHILVYFLCHASCRKDLHDLMFLDNFSIDRFASNSDRPAAAELFNQRLDVYQLQFLLRLKALATKLDGGLQVSKLEEMLQQTSNQDLIEMYVNLASFFLPDFPLKRLVSDRDIRKQRRQFVVDKAALLIADTFSESVKAEAKAEAQIAANQKIENEFQARLVELESKIDASISQKLASASLIETLEQHDLIQRLETHIEHRIIQRMKGFVKRVGGSLLSRDRQA